MADALQELSDQVKRQMNQPQIHQDWEKTYRTPDHERLCELVFDDFVKWLGQPEGSLALDIGCGNGSNTVRLARRGYRVCAGDYSEAILPETRQNIAQKNLADRVTITREDILNLSFPSDHFDLTLCWGVLMHVPDVARAVTELARVTKPGGSIVLEELNHDSPEARSFHLLWQLFKRNKIKIASVPAGSEYSCEFEGETQFWRHTNMRWLADQFAGHSCTLARRSCSMFTELNKYTPGKLAAPVHSLNRFWTRHINLPRLSYHNLLIFRKTANP